MTRSYTAEGEQVAGQPVYYGVDQLGSVRRAFASPTTAPAYAYAPYGAPLQSGTPLTDFGYAGMVHHPESGLSLATYRAYDPVAGRWLSRDPIGELGGINLYAYVGGNPVNLVDPKGDNPLLLVGAAAFLAAALTPQPANAPAPCEATQPNNPATPIVNGAAAGTAVAGGVAGIARLGAGTAGNNLPPLNISNKQLGKKYGQHKNDVGANSSGDYKKMIEGIYSDPNSNVTYVPSDAPVHAGEIEIRNGGTLLRIDGQGNFISMY